MSETVDEYYRRMGRKDHFPECCIDYFILYVDTDSFWKAYLGYVNELRNSGEYSNGRRRFGGYVPCPKCLEGNVRVPEERVA